MKIENKRIILYASSLIILLMLIFPPYTISERGTVLATGYGFLFKLPRMRVYYYDHLAPVVNTGLLSLQIFGVAIVSILLYKALNK
jgi:hypothetical protein